MRASLTLGGIVFTDFEIPEHFVIGGRQKLTIHSLPGGGRVVDAMGAEDAPIRWSGVFSGQQAAERARMLDGLRRAGTVQTLAWDAWRYTVIVQEFEAEITSSWWIPYSIQLCVVPYSGRQDQDWLITATAPVLSIGSLTAATLDTQISAAGIGVFSNNLGQAAAASGLLAQAVTARAYGLLSS